MRRCATCRCCSVPQDDVELCYLEHREYGVSHDALGAALCESWGLAAAAVHCVRHHVEIHTTRRLPRGPRPAICALAALAGALMNAPDTLDEVADAVAPQAQLDLTLVLRGARRVQQQFEAMTQRSAAASRQ